MKLLIQKSTLLMCVLYLFFGGCTKLKSKDDQNSDNNSVKAEAGYDSGVIRTDAGRDAVAIKEAGKGIDSSQVEDAESDSKPVVDSSQVKDTETDSEAETDSCETPGKLRCDGFAQAQRSICSETGFWKDAKSCPDEQLCDTKALSPAECKPVVPTCQGRNPGEAFCDGSDRVVCGPDLVDIVSTACESIQHCQNGTGSDCAVCLSNSYSCEGNLLRECKDDHTGYQDYMNCDEIGKPCNEEAGACTSKACLEDQLRCNGDDLEICNEDQSSFELEESCGEGLCDSDNLKCDLCFSNVLRCAEDGVTVITCLKDGLSESEQACPNETPFCVGAGRCAQCKNNTQCDDGNPCTQNLCEQNACSYPPIPNDCNERVCGNSPSGCYQCGNCAATGERCSEGSCETCNTAAYCGPSCSACASGSSAPVCGGATTGCVCSDDSCGSESRCIEGSCENCVLQCDEIGVTCSDSNLVSCQQDENGCRIRTVQSCPKDCIGSACVHRSCVGEPAGGSCNLGSTSISCCKASEIPAGVVAMGRCENTNTANCNDAYADGSSNELPEHKVRVDGFYMDIFEVTVGRFRKYVDAYRIDASTLPSVGAGSNPAIPGSGWQKNWDSMLPETTAAMLASLMPEDDESTWTNTITTNEQYPINRVSWFLAFAFCIWDGGRLPTEAEWEYAASGGEDNNFLYPWGTASPSGDPQRANCNVTARSPYVNVGSYPYGKSVFEIHDLAGSLYEWNLDWYAIDWYLQPQSSSANGANLIEGTRRVWRGAAYGQGPSNIRVARRSYGTPTQNYQGTGIRCVYNRN